MSRRKRKVPKTGPVWRQSAEEATMSAKPYFNGYACGHGPHGDAKYNRARSKRAWKQDLHMQRAPERGPFPFPGARPFARLGEGRLFQEAAAAA